MPASRPAYHWLLTVLWVMAGAAQPAAAGRAKTGAGLLLCCNGDMLLLRRKSKHNDKMWGLPGGNTEQGDANSLLGTASREAMEEMGAVPPFEVKAQFHTVRGKNDDKHFTVFLAKVDALTRTAFVPKLNEEHSEWKWVPLAQLPSMKEQLHPVVKKLLKHHHQQLLAATAEMSR